MTLSTEQQRARAAEWFETLRTRICAAFEALERELEGDSAARFAGTAPGRFERRPGSARAAAAASWR